MFGLGMQEILILALIVLLFFGGKKIPELMRGLGKSIVSRLRLASSFVPIRRSMR